MRSCVNLLAVLLWAATSDKFGRRAILLPLQTFLCVVLFTVGGLQWSGATTGNVAAGTALVSPSLLTKYSSGAEVDGVACNLLFLDILVPGYCYVAIRLLGRTSFCHPSK